MELLFNDITLGVFTILILIYSAILHEIAHGYVAERLGDPTARILGRLTLDPRPHIDLFLSVLVPLMLYLSHLPIFGGAKPVPVDPFNFREPRKDFALVSLAGPLTNILIAVIATLFIKLFFHGTLFVSGVTLADFIHTLLAITVTLNIYLAIFNLLPIPPLDGSKVFSLLLPEQTAARYLALGNIGFFLLYILLFLPIGGFSLLSVVRQLFTFTLSLLGF
jgi:Zn-dependent protease